MRIALDARTVFSSQRRGTGKNLIDLYTHLAALRPDWPVVGYHREAAAASGPANIEPRRIEMRGDRFDAWGKLRLPMAAWRDGADVLHCPANDCPGWFSVPTVVTIHDLIPLDFAGALPMPTVKRFEKSVRTVCREAAWIITPSDYTRNRLIREFHADPTRVTVNAWAADSAVRRVPSDRWQKVLSRYKINRPFALHFGAGDTGPGGRKNTRRLLEAWSMLEPAVRRRWTLLVVGLDRPGFDRLLGVAKNLGVTRSVRLAGFAPEGDLPTLLSAADTLAYPSLSEGFGLPILDAWATATPVLASNTTSIPEVAGHAAVLVDPADPCGIARGLCKTMCDTSLRRNLVQRGAHRSRRYTWERTATRFAWVMRSVAALSGKPTLRRAA